MLQQLYGNIDSVITLIFQMENLRHRVDKYLAHIHIVRSSKI